MKSFDGVAQVTELRREIRAEFFTGHKAASENLDIDTAAERNRPRLSGVIIQWVEFPPPLTEQRRRDAKSSRHIGSDNPRLGKVGVKIHAPRLAIR